MCEFIIENKGLIKSIVRRKYKGNEYLFEYINLFDRNDLFQEVCIYLLTKEAKDRQLILSDIYQAIHCLIRSAKTRKSAAKNINTFTGYNINSPEYIDKYIEYHNGKTI